MFNHLPGFRDFLPEDCAFRNFLFRIWRQSARLHGYSEYDTPVLESLDLYRAKSGDEIVEQLFHFRDKGEREVALRPELTPGLARLVASRASALKKPIRWFSIGENYRYERMQKGRLRAFYQWNVDILGEEDPGADAELVGVALHCFETLGLTSKDVVLRLSDRKLWFLFLAALGLEGERAGEVLAVVDKWERLPEDVVREKLVPFLGEAAEDFQGKVNDLLSIRDPLSLEKFLSAHLVSPEQSEVLSERMSELRTLWETLANAGWGDWVSLDLGIVRGLAYYTGFVFEAFERSGKSRALAGGGRYDHLVEKLGGPSLAAVGFGMGDVTLSDLLRERGLVPEWIQHPDAFLVFGNDECRAKCVGLASHLRRCGVVVEMAIKSAGFKKQFNLATQSGALLAVLLGEDELAAGEATLRSLRDRKEVRVPLDKVPLAVRDFLNEGEFSATP